MKTNIDRWVFRIAGALALLASLLAYLYSPYWLWLSGFVGANMLQASFTGFCPLAKILAALGAPEGAAFCAAPKSN